MTLQERFYQYKGTELLEFKELPTLAEYINFLRSTYKNVYKLKFTHTEKELVVLFFYNEELSHVTTYKLNQFKK